MSDNLTNAVRDLIRRKAIIEMGGQEHSMHAATAIKVMDKLAPLLEAADRYITGGGTFGDYSAYCAAKAALIKGST